MNKRNFCLKVIMLGLFSWQESGFSQVDCSQMQYKKLTPAEQQRQGELFAITGGNTPLQLPAGTKTENLPIRVYQLDNFASLLGKQPMPSNYVAKTFPVYLPANGPAKGVVVITPGSEGIKNDLSGAHIRNFLNAGFAVAVANSFEFRGRSEVLTDQAAVTMPSQVSDVLWAIRSLRENPTFSKLPIGVFGTSRGGQVIQLLWDKRVMHSVLNSLQGPQALATLYPATNLAYAHPQTLDIPFRLVGGAKDDEVSPENTKKVFSQLAQPGLSISWLQAPHIFDAPVQSTFLPGSSFIKAPIVSIANNGDYTLGNQHWNKWSNVVDVYNKAMTCGIHLGEENNSRNQSLRIMKQFFLKNLK